MEVFRLLTPNYGIISKLKGKNMNNLIKSTKSIEEIKSKVAKLLASSVNYSNGNKSFDSETIETELKSILEDLENYTCKSCGAKQAQIDRLMLEYCPNEMTEEQLEEWGKHQKAVDF